MCCANVVAVLLCELYFFGLLSPLYFSLFSSVSRLYRLPLLSVCGTNFIDHHTHKFVFKSFLILFAHKQ